MEMIAACGVIIKSLPGYMPMSAIDPVFRHSPLVVDHAWLISHLTRTWHIVVFCIECQSFFKTWFILEYGKYY